MAVLEFLEESTNGQEEKLVSCLPPPQSGWNCGAISHLLIERCIWILMSINLLIIEFTRMNALRGDERVESLAGHCFQ